MDPGRADDSDATLPSGAFTGRRAFQECVETGLQAAAARSWRELILCDADFLDWPLDRPGVLAALTGWARYGQSFVMLAVQYDDVVRSFPRFTRWRRHWAHRVNCLAVDPIHAQALPSLLWAPGWALRRHNQKLCTGYCDTAADRQQQLRELVDDWLARGSSAFPAATLGL